MRRGGLVASLTLLAGILAAGCGGEAGGPTVTFDAVVLLFDFGTNDSAVVGAELCVTRPILGDCAVTDGSGIATLDVPADADVLLTVSRDDLYPFLLPVHPGDAPLMVDFQVYPIEIVNAVAASLGREVDPATGQITTAATPSQDGNRGEVLQLADPVTGEAVASDPFYVDESGRPDPLATGTPSNGWGGFVNVEPGEYLIDIGYNGRCNTIRGWPSTMPDGSPAMRVPVEAGAVTGVQWVECTAP